MFHAYKPGKTKLIEGIQLAAEMVDGWNPKSTYVLLLTDGDTVPDKGMPKMPASVAETIVIGLGNPESGTFIDGHQSRQDVTTLRRDRKSLAGDLSQWEPETPDLASCWETAGSKRR